MTLGARYPSQGAEMNRTSYSEIGREIAREAERLDDALIAAAPDLLAALESLLAVCVEELDDKRTPEMRQARNAIAKAKGQA